ncbi:MAG TPA: non-homologous end-joining DNA ligase [Bacillales bacterium]|nr:non-homologous end-joining DNA ligase [Bacillales bacterium]
MVSSLDKPMLPTLVSELPEGEEWRYEVKYDGYRASLLISEDRIDLVSRNLHSFNVKFPEVIEEIRSLIPQMKHALPLRLDGELCILNSDHKADFETMQIRGRIGSERKIPIWAESHPADFAAFDILEISGDNLRSLPFLERKQKLRELFSSLNLPLEVNHDLAASIHYVPCYENGERLWKQIKGWDSEGIIAKKTSSHWVGGKRTRNWLKIKNWKTATFFLTAYDKESDYFHVAVMREGKPFEIGLFSHGLEGDERNALIDIMRTNQTEENARMIWIQPSICVDLQFIELYKEGLRQPRFKAFRLDQNWEDCTWEAVLKNVQRSILTEKQ